MSLLELPVELLHRILSSLPLSSVHILGSVNRRLHALIHQDDRLWRFKVRKTHRLLLLREETEEEPEDDDYGEQDDFEALLRDPTLRGHKELFLLYADEFKEALKQHRERDRRSRSEAPLRTLRAFLPRFLLRGDGSLADDEIQARLALFGPGIESAHTKHLVHKVVNSHTDLFDALAFVSGLPGGFGSGVKISFRQAHAFNLMCLYTNSGRVRENQKGVDRLLAANNKLLVKDVAVEEENEKPTLHDSVLKLLPTLDALVYAIDATELNLLPTEEKRAEQLKFLKSELFLMIDGLDEQDRHTPILVLSCSWQGRAGGVGVRYLADGLGLRGRVKRPWAIYNVDIADMEGMARSLDWLLYHIRKRRTSLKYHYDQSEKL